MTPPPDRWGEDTLHHLIANYFKFSFPYSSQNIAKILHLTPPENHHLSRVSWIFNTVRECLPIEHNGTWPSWY